MKQNLETKVGLFLMAGIAVLCTLIIFFGEVKDIFKPTYNITVSFPNASGLLKGSDVYLSGAPIGKVTSDPHPVPDTQKVEVSLKIDKTAGVRQDARYVIGSSGLLGDRFVEVQPVEYPDNTPDEKKAPFVKDGERIEGTTSASLDELADSAKPLIQRANDIALKVDNMINKFNDEVLTDNSTKDLKDTIAKLKDMVTNADDLLSQAKSGKGALGRLINDKQVGDNLADFIANLKKSGPMFYKDDAAVKDDKNKDGKKK
jgi:phospholipid/cholesterol/gamma-HCH transport system substrate-binding protein